ncbi:MAG TPA: prepilin-type N-terminal cleavage/methylation domain-containing protein [Candidatus Saccharimonadales bacterium]|nr:prepilin-type N-terminal cleavage/methylation domain-containing protein [Candidatus Saccharimonadales bacterium]
MRRPQQELRLSGFTLVELLVVIAVIAVLASIVIVAYNGISMRARNVRIQSDIEGVQKLIETYRVTHGSYPQTTTNTQANWRAADVYSDSDCSNGSQSPDWVPGLEQTLPQSGTSKHVGADGKTGCYLYVSDGREYVLSAWNMLGTPQTSTLYRRLGFREFQTDTSTQFYTCNSNPVGGATGGYDITKDYYKHSYTVSNITNCDETPPPGA